MRFNVQNWIKYPIEKSHLIKKICIALFAVHPLQRSVWRNDLQSHKYQNTTAKQDENI